MTDYLGVVFDVMTVVGPLLLAPETGGTSLLAEEATISRLVAKYGATAVRGVLEEYAPQALKWFGHLL